MPRNPDETIRSIMQATIALINERGFDNVSPQDVCRKLGISRGTFYYHFKSIVDVLDRFQSSKVAFTSDVMLWVLGGETPVDRILRLEKWASNRFDVISDTDARIAQWFYHCQHGDADDSREFVSLVEHLAAEAQKAGQAANPADPAVVAAAIDAMVDGEYLHWCSTRGECDLMEEIANKTLAVLGVTGRTAERALGGMRSVEVPGDIVRS